MNVELTQNDFDVLVVAHGEVDVSNAETLREKLNVALACDVTGLVVDMSDVSYIDSTGIGCLVGACQRAKEVGKSFELLHPQDNVERVLTLLGVADELHVAR